MVEGRVVLQEYPGTGDARSVGQIDWRSHSHYKDQEVECYQAGCRPELGSGAWEVEAESPEGF